MLQMMTMVTALNLSFPKSIYNDPNRFMVSWWVTYSSFNNEKFKKVILKL